MEIDGKPIEYEWNISQDLRHCRFSIDAGCFARAVSSLSLDM